MKNLILLLCLLATNAVFAEGESKMTKLSCGLEQDWDGQATLAIYGEGWLHCIDRANNEKYQVHFKGATIGAGFSTGAYRVNCQHYANSSIRGSYNGLKLQLVLVGGGSYGKYWNSQSL